MHGGQTAVPCGRKCLLPWGWPAMVKQEKAVLLCFPWKKNRKIYGGNRNRNIKKMAGKHFPIGIGKQIGKIGSKKGPESGIRRNSGGIPPEFTTKALGRSSGRRKSWDLLETKSLRQGCSGSMQGSSLSTLTPILTEF